MKMKMVELLRAGRKVITDPKNFAQGSYARTANGGRTGSCQDDAVAWDATGALRKAYPECSVFIEEDVSESVLYKASLILAQAAAQAGYTGVFDLNDRGGHAAVLAVYDAAITALG